MFTKDSLVSLLRENVVTVTFTKVDGSERVMRCTLQNNYLPSPANTASLLQDNFGSDNNVSAWDVEVGGWRSFRVSSVKNVIVEGNSTTLLCG